MPGPDTPAQIWLKDLRSGQSVHGHFLVTEKRVGRTRNGKPFLSLRLADKSGEVEAKVWDGAENLAPLFQRGTVVEVAGRVDSFKDALQISITDLKPGPESWDPRLFLEGSPADLTEMLSDLKALVKGIRNPDLKALLERFLADRDFMAVFKEAPAAKNVHHDYLGGLLEHTLGVMRLADQIAAMYSQLDRDLLVTAAFLHDIGKVRELSYSRGIDYTDEGRLLGHIVLGIEMLTRRLDDMKHFPRVTALKLQHLIASHHGEYAFGAPKRPKFVEGFALHLIDDLDAKINAVSRWVARDTREGAWTEFHRLFERFFLKGEIGCETAAEPPPPLVEGGQGRLFEPA